MAQINKRIKGEIDFNLSIRGINPREVRGRSDEGEGFKLTEDQKKALDIAREKAVKRKQAEFKNGKR